MPTSHIAGQWAMPSGRVSDDDKPSSVALSDNAESEKEMVFGPPIVDVREVSSNDNAAKVDGDTAFPPIEDYEKGYHDSPPDGGLLAWLQVFAGWILVMNSR